MFSRDNVVSHPMVGVLFDFLRCFQAGGSGLIYTYTYTLIHTVEKVVVLERIVDNFSMMYGL